ncbi:hypothetical protein ZHAS_00011528 [Anopheles sinensis]|uniref:Uncharacterized protein n=1 Tax=Anopheles sinensis TaxID=74873 RepID=A0A084W047_ANOSI|nr:hypothetical protein ZHAS_00011528 [Anopheles sinensis]
MASLRAFSSGRMLARHVFEFSTRIDLRCIAIPYIALRCTICGVGAAFEVSVGQHEQHHLDSLAANKRQFFISSSLCT